MYFFQLANMNANITTNFTSSYSRLPTAAGAFTVHNAVSIISYPIASFGFLLNVFTIVIIYHYKPLHKQMTIAFIVNQSVIDASASVFLLFLTKKFPKDSSIKIPGYFFDEILCRYWFTRAPMWATFQSSVYGIVALTFDKFLLWFTQFGT